MPENRIAYNQKQKTGSALLILTLLWLTISLPCLYAAQMAEEPFKQTSGHTPLPGKETGNPLADTSEETASSGSMNTLAEEFIHHPEETVSLFATALCHSTIHLVSSYEAFHGELLCPPPNCSYSFY